NRIIMSEYQYYEFQALDRILTKTEQSYIESLSSRVELSPTKAAFTYSYGDFRGNPQDLLEKCFDVMLYMANWGTRQLLFRLPKKLVDATLIKQYCVDDCISVSNTSNYLILDININDEEYQDWIEGEGWLSNLASLRNELLQGDCRVLYLAWLKAKTRVCDDYELSEDESDVLEPPVPANLQKLSDSLQSFVEFFKVDNDLITVAAKASNSTQAEFTSLETLIPTLPEAERNDFLVKVLKNEPLIGVQLAKRLKELSKSQLTLVQSNGNRRLLFQLIASAKDCSKLRQQQELKAVKEARIRELLALIPKEAKLWEEVFRLIAFKQSKSYDDAIAHLRNLRDLAEYQGKLEQFKLRVQEMQTDYSNRPGLLSRLQKAGLLSL
ncbi:hypothetical protein, partial [Dolichospermum sp. LEGE 00246]|uniref:hypothetical protein n=1 Tax=Dolichospermum sp. LEGE 00246 TaxID=1828605 RepID=UPI001D136AA6